MRGLFFFNDTATTEIYTLSLHRRSSDLTTARARARGRAGRAVAGRGRRAPPRRRRRPRAGRRRRQGARLERYARSEEHTSELQSRQYLACRLLLENKSTACTLVVARRND